ncbi:hypothetical protein CJU90_3937 [Yarrowia sp. C11]|nr:hypothetical protein CKK34_5549 [Yarrowia sp. E02]KAG5367636.1 hypothetical protein CJU90_3937 [Yarrowia sp. C11]
MAITRTLTKTFKTITRSRSSPFLRKQAEDEEDGITPLQPAVPPPKQLRLDLDFAETLNLDFHQIDFSDDSKLQAWTEKNTPKLALDEGSWLAEKASDDDDEHESVLAPRSVSNGFFESPLSTPTTPGSEWFPDKARDLSRELSGQQHTTRDLSRDLPDLPDLAHDHLRDHSPRDSSNSSVTIVPAAIPAAKPSLAAKAAAKALNRPPMNQSKSCSNLPKRSKSHSGTGVATGVNARQFVRAVSDTQTHSTHNPDRHTHNPSHNSHNLNSHNSHNHNGFSTHNGSTHTSDSNVPVTTPKRGNVSDRVKRFEQMGDKSNGHSGSSHGSHSHGPSHGTQNSIRTSIHTSGVHSGAHSGAKDLPDLPHQRNMSVASVDTVSGYMDPSLASTISRYYRLERASEKARASERERTGKIQEQQEKEFQAIQEKEIKERNNLASSVVSTASSEVDSRGSSTSSPLTPSLDRSSTFTMSPSTSTTMSTPSLVDSPSSPSSCTSMSFDKAGPSHSTPVPPPTQPLQVPAPRPFTLYSTDNDLVPPPRSKYRSRHYRFDSSSSSVYSNSFVKEDYMGALRQSLYVPRDEDTSSPSIRPVSAFDIPQLSADDYASVIKEGQWF